MLFILALAVATLTLAQTTFSPKDYTRSFAKCPTVHRELDQPISIDLCTSRYSNAILDRLTTITTYSLRRCQPNRKTYTPVCSWMAGFVDHLEQSNSRFPTEISSRCSGLTRFWTIFSSRGRPILWNHGGPCWRSRLCVTTRVCIKSCLHRVSIVSKPRDHHHLCTMLSHDWGAQLCYEAARMRPDIFTAVVGSVIPVSRLHLYPFKQPTQLETVHRCCRPTLQVRRARKDPSYTELSGLLREEHG
jgi:hypothetical protein